MLFRVLDDDLEAGEDCTMLFVELRDFLQIAAFVEELPGITKGHAPDFLKHVHGGQFRLLGDSLLTFRNRARDVRFCQVLSGSVRF